MLLILVSLCGEQMELIGFDRYTGIFNILILQHASIVTYAQNTN